MSSSLCAPKISDVLQILSEQADIVENYENACAKARSNDHRNKQVFTDAVNYCMVLLRKTDRITNHRSEVLSDEATLMGHEMFERIINIDVQMDVESEDESLSSMIQQQIKLEPEEYLNDITIQAYSLATQTEETSPATSPSSSPSPDQPTKNPESTSKVLTDVSPRSGRKVVEISQGTMRDFFRQSKGLSPQILPNHFDDKQLPPSPVSLAGSDDTGDVPVKKQTGSKLRVQKNLIPLETKMKVVALARAHPTWNLRKLRERGSTQLRTMEQVKQWERQIDNGGTLRDKYRKINTWTYERFVEARAKSQRVSTKMLRQWAVQAARDFYGTSIKFDAGHHWCLNFKKVYGLHGSTMHGYFTRDEPLAETTIEELRLLEKKTGERENKGRSE